MLDMGGLSGNAVFWALIWMLLANLFAIGPNKLKVAALVVMLITAGPIILAVVEGSGWLVGFPLLVLMLIQMRWAGYMILRLGRHYRIIPPKAE